MDVQRTMEFILDMQAKSEARMAKHDGRMAKYDERMAKADERMAKADERMDKFDKRLEATRKLVETGMRILVKIEKSQHELTVQVSALTEAQRKSDRKFERFMDSWARQRTNGHRPKG